VKGKGKKTVGTEKKTRKSCATACSKLKRAFITRENDGGGGRENYEKKKKIHYVFSNNKGVSSSRKKDHRCHRDSRKPDFEGKPTKICIWGRLM